MCTRVTIRACRLFAVTTAMTLAAVGGAIASPGGGGHSAAAHSSGGGFHAGAASGFHGGGRNGYGPHSGGGYHHGARGAWHGGHGYYGGGHYGWGSWWGGLGYGAFVPILPWYGQRLWWGGVPYYYADDTYYLWNDAMREYEVVGPPAGFDQTSSATSSPAAADLATGFDLFAYPKGGQSAEQQALDRGECRRWAADQTGVGRPKVDSSVTRDAEAANPPGYLRAEAACLEARNYSVK